MRYPIQPMPPDLWPAVREIYGEGIATGNATFETELPEWEKWDASHHKHCRLIALEPGDETVSEILIPLDGARVLAWAALSPVSSRRVYAGWRRYPCTWLGLRAAGEWEEHYCRRWSGIAEERDLDSSGGNLP